MRLRFDDRNRLLKVTHPRSVRSATALAWAASQKLWVEDQISSAMAPEPFVAGALIPLEGEEIELCWTEKAPRTPRLDGGKLVCGGPSHGFSRRIDRFLRSRALDRLSLETEERAASAGLRPTSITVGDARTRWGSCSSKGAIRYSWRLILAQPEARRYVVCHEVAHLKHLDHGAAFKAFECELFGGDTRGAAALLRDSAPRLRRIGLSA